MTAQFHDIILLDSKEFSIVGVNGTGLFTPQSIGLTPMAVNSACWRGYICRYKIVDSNLILDRLQVSLGTHEESSTDKKLTPQRGPAINGVNPKKEKPNRPTFANIYEDLNLKIPFSGGILAGEDFISELYVHMGFHPAWKYRLVSELIIADGIVKDIRDVSKSIEQIRNKLSKLPLEPDFSTISKEEGEEWIAKTFRLEYDVNENPSRS